MAKKRPQDEEPEEASDEEPEDEASDEDIAPPPKKKKAAKPDAPPVMDTAGDPDEAEAAPEPPKKTKTGTGKRPRPDAQQRRAPRGPQAEPPKRGVFDYFLAVVGPIACMGAGTLAFLQINKSLERLFSNAIIRDMAVNPDVDIQKEFLPKLATFVPIVHPWGHWMPIALGGILGIVGAVALLKMTPGIGARMVGLGCMLPGVLVPVVFFGEGKFIGDYVDAQVRARYFKSLRGKTDPRGLDFKCNDLPMRKFQSLWKIDLDEGEIPIAWLSLLEEVAPNEKDETIANKNERKLRSIDLRDALASSRELMKDEKNKAELEPIAKKLEEMRDKVADPLQTTTETERNATGKLEEQWMKFLGRTKSEKALSMPESPKQKWFKSFVTFGEVDASSRGTTKADRAAVEKWYVGKAARAALTAAKIPEVPPDVKYVAAYYAEVDPEFVGKDDVEKALTKFKFVFFCYDLEHPENPPFFIPYLKGVLDEARFNLEVLGK